MGDFIPDHRRYILRQISAQSLPYFLLSMHETLTYLCRSGASDRSGWGTLPLHLLDKIFQNLQPRVRSILQMRLVCKGWRSACSEFTGAARINLGGNKELLWVSRILPGLQNLHLYNELVELNSIDLSPLSSLSQLSSLRVQYYESMSIDHSFDLVILPSTLRALKLYHCSVDSQCFPNISCTALTRLSIEWTENTASEVVALLQHLPLLQVNYYSKLCWSVILLFDSSKNKTIFCSSCWQVV